MTDTSAHGHWNTEKNRRFRDFEPKIADNYTRVTVPYVMFATDVSSDTLEVDGNLPELASWDFLQSLDFELEPELAGCPLPQSAVTVTSSSERLKEKNRKAQKKFRERKKVSWCSGQLSPIVSRLVLTACTALI